MAIRKPAFITKQIRGGRQVQTRPFKWAPGIPSLAIQFDEVPGESAARGEAPVTDNVLGNQELFAITTQDGFMIGILLP